MKKIQKSSELLWLLGTIFVAIGVSICSKANLGVSMIAAPAFVIQEALVNILPLFSVGMTEYVIQGILLILLCLIIRKFNWRFIFAFLVAFIYGYVLDLFLWILSPISFNYVWLRYVMLLVGDIVTAFGVACFFKTYLPLQVYELFVAATAHSFNFKISTVKSVFDKALLVISIVLALSLFGDVTTFDWSTIYYKSFHSIGLGTIITTLINPTLINTCSIFIDKIFEPTARFTSLEKFLKHN
jgi:uncharacterized membrane protein YczE